VKLCITKELITIIDMIKHISYYIGGILVPIIGRFYNIIVKMYYFEDEHNPPHIHAKYNEYEGIFNLITGEMTRGNLPKSAKRLVKEFIFQHQDRLLSMWSNQDFEELTFEE
jgi:hypothetical protein